MKSTPKHKLLNQPLYSFLTSSSKKYFFELIHDYYFTFQELKQLIDIYIDFKSWGLDLKKTILNFKKLNTGSLISYLLKVYTQEKRKLVVYASGKSIVKKPVLKFKFKDDSNTIFGFCPVRSEKGLCCNLRTLDVILGCGFSCQYCAIQTSYHKNNIIFHKNLDEKLVSIVLENNKKYHIGSGQSSDALMFGNKNGVLDSLAAFAKSNPNVFLELKTKSSNVEYLLQNEVPKNMFPSWTLSPSKIISNEELLTASLKSRISSAKKITRKGGQIAFHFHPVLQYDGWKKDYEIIINSLIRNFRVHDVLFVSIGAIHFAKPVLRKIRELGAKTQAHKMEFEENPEGKLTCKKQVKEQIFKFIYDLLKPWHGKVFIYLCMETEDLWKKTFGFAYSSNEQFEQAFLNELEKKIYGECLW